MNRLPLPDGATRWRGFDRFLDIMEAMQSRQGIGSKTAYNTEALKQMGAGGLFSAAAKIGANP